MKTALRVGLVGDLNPDVMAHQAIPLALKFAADAAGTSISPEWLPTQQIGDASRLRDFDGLWCVPGSPYRSMGGALRAIRLAREQGLPFLGSCGGFQHALIEYARNVLGWADAEHAETAPQAPHAVIVPLECALVEVARVVHLLPGSIIAAAYASGETLESYHCRYGVSAELRAALAAGPLRVTANDELHDVRAVELDGHPFFVATLFQPERAALQGHMPPLVAAFVRAVVQHSGNPGRY